MLIPGYPVPGAACPVPGARSSLPGARSSLPGGDRPYPGARCLVPGDQKDQCRVTGNANAKPGARHPETAGQKNCPVTGVTGDQLTDARKRPGARQPVDHQRMIDLLANHLDHDAQESDQVERGSDLSK